MSSFIRTTLGLVARAALRWGPVAPAACVKVPHFVNFHRAPFFGGKIVPSAEFHDTLNMDPCRRDYRDVNPVVRALLILAPGLVAVTLSTPTAPVECAKEKQVTDSLARQYHNSIVHRRSSSSSLSTCSRLSYSADPAFSLTYCMCSSLYYTWCNQ
jgi:hypothetical protein